ncbi:hypothetical protein [Vibrio gangliei]|uniref:hypothetical protein n=1 Tax=Vibrio gangliei TaxID=2077090 RepID=UPI000D014DB7|nr:hypothetical protein [Vibrio gangliei]
MGLEALAFIVDGLVTACCMYIASRLSFLTIDFTSLLVITLLVALVSLIPTIGWILGLIVWFYLLKTVANADFKDCLWVIVTTKAISVGVLALMAAMIH